jgi:hypothetical protein
LLGLGTFALINFLKFDLIALIKIAIAVPFDGGIVNKHLTPPLFGFNETITLHAAKPFDRSTFLRHDVTSTTGELPIQEEKLVCGRRVLS